MSTFAVTGRDEVLRAREALADPAGARGLALERYLTRGALGWGRRREVRHEALHALVFFVPSAPHGHPL